MVSTMGPSVRRYEHSRRPSGPTEKTPCVSVRLRRGRRFDVASTANRLSPFDAIRGARVSDTAILTCSTFIGGGALFVERLVLFVGVTGDHESMV